MSVKKTIHQSSNLSVKFSLSCKTVQQVAVVGDFNNWDPSIGKLKNGTFVGVLIG
jgi:hypothetical protein